ncbi:MAG: Gfo/Idh/MocA family oxidoreductase [Firmicutes bacterium]|nr:Gfo/Idh/MocA family oxidoreductase [Bacillota bacterium]
METVRIGVIGVGNIGRHHAQYLAEGRIRGAELTAACDADPAARAWVAARYPGVAVFESMEGLWASGRCDAVIVAVPHYGHPPAVMAALAHGLHVLVEKPAGVTTQAVKAMNAAARASGRVFAIMYNQRANPVYQKVRDLVTAGELGPLRRTQWVVTTWYRSQSYYDSGQWRATWAGEGGGVLLNQAPHQLDLWLWVTGLRPQRVRAFCHFGKYHAIEVEDEVTAYVEFAGGATGVFITSTAEAPGTNRLEIVGDRGKVEVEGNRLVFWRLRMSEREFNRTYRGGFGAPEAWECRIPVAGSEGRHEAITQNWVDAIRTGAPLLAPGDEGLAMVELANAMLLSTWQDGWVTVPVDEAAYEAALQARIQASQAAKAGSGRVLDVGASFE